MPVLVGLVLGSKCDSGSMEQPAYYILHTESHGLLGPSPFVREILRTGFRLTTPRVLGPLEGKKQRSLPDYYYPCNNSVWGKTACLQLGTGTAGGCDGDERYFFL